MNFVVLFRLVLALAHADGVDLQSLDSCIGRLKKFEQDVSSSASLRTLIPLDRRLNFMIEGIHYAQVNSEKLKEFVSSGRSDRQSPYLVSNAVVACEADESRLTSYLGGLKKFLVLFFITTLSISIYGAYLFARLVRVRERDR